MRMNRLIQDCLPLAAKRNQARLKRKLRSGITRLIVYFLLTGVGVVFLYPILYMIVYSFKSLPDLVNPTIEWIPSRLYLENYQKALVVLDYGRSFLVTVALVSLATVLQTTSCALAGYALARHNLPLKKLWLVCVVLAFLIPTQVTLIPKYLMFHTYRLVGSPLSVLLPAAFGQGISSSVFVLVFHRFFSGYPLSFDEAARIDGAGSFTVFYKIALPMCIPAIIVSLLFSFVWFWNETYLSGLLLGEKFRTLPMKLQSFVDEFNRSFGAVKGSINKVNESIRLAATLLVISPLLVLYLVLQRQFIEGIESSGITGE
jgi:multiple sugar transport system permease protein